ncbi:MAG TPA: permease [Nannocystis sp.]
MRAALFLLAGALLILSGLAAAKGVFVDGLQRSLRTFAAMTPILLVAFLLAGMAEALLPPGFVERWLSDAAGPRGFLVAWLAGVLTPAGGLVGMPLVAGLLKAGAGVGVLVTYLTSMTLLPLLRVPMEVGIYGGRLALLRIAASLVLPLLAGVIAQAIARLVQPTT